MSTAKDTHDRPTVVDLVPTEPRVYPVGRLDAETEGLIILTNDGELTNRLTHPKYGVEKEYLATVEPAPVAPSVISRSYASRTDIAFDVCQTNNWLTEVETRPIHWNFAVSNRMFGVPSFSSSGSAGAASPITVPSLGAWL